MNRWIMKALTNESVNSKKGPTPSDKIVQEDVFLNHGETETEKCLNKQKA